MEITIKINGHPYRMNVYDNQIAKEVIKHLPEELVMEDLNNKEKYASLNKSFPTNAEKVGGIYKGDVMLYGSDTLVIFYKNFETPYSYTPVCLWQYKLTQDCSLKVHNLANKTY